MLVIVCVHSCNFLFPPTQVLVHPMSAWIIAFTKHTMHIPGLSLDDGNKHLTQDPGVNFDGDLSLYLIRNYLHEFIGNL